MGSVQGREIRQTMKLAAFVILFLFRSALTVPIIIVVTYCVGMSIFLGTSMLLMIPINGDSGFSIYALLGIIGKFVPLEQLNGPHEIDLIPVFQLIVRSYFTATFWLSVLLQFLGQILKRSLVISSRAKTVTFLGIIAFHALIFGVFIYLTGANGFLNGLVAFFVTLVVGGIPLTAILVAEKIHNERSKQQIDNTMPVSLLVK